MIVELSLLTSFVLGIVIVFHTIMVKRHFKILHARLFELETRTNYQHVAMAYNDLIPMPWELEDLDEHYEHVKRFKQDGNVVYLNKEQNNDE